MKTLDLNTRSSHALSIILICMIISLPAFASGLTKMEPMPIQPVVSSNFDYLLTTLNEEVSEEALTVESWMLNPESFEAEEEQALALEGWMTDLNSFIIVVSEPELALENWMTDIQSFIPVSYEPTLALENWMTDLDSFIAPAQILARK